MMDWEEYNRVEAHGVAVAATLNDEVDEVDMSIEISAVDREFCQEHFTGRKIAGDDVTYKFSSYGALQIKVGKFKAKGQLSKAIMYGILENHFNPTAEFALNKNWYYQIGTTELFKKRKDIKILFRDDKVIGIYTHNAKLKRTIKWYDQAIYKSNSWKNMQTHKLRDFKPEYTYEDDVYKDEYPTFDRADELLEITEFIASLRGRRLSVDEQLILGDLKAELDMLVD